MSQQDRLTIEALNLNLGNSVPPLRPRRRRRPESRPIPVSDSISMSQEARREEECDSGVCANFLAAWS